MEKKSAIQKTVSIKNKRASFEYQFIDTFIAGIVLQGTEIKSIRLGNVNLTDAFCVFHQNSLVVRNMSIAAYKEGTHYNHNPLKDRTLLLKKKELKKLKTKLEEKGLAIVVVKLFINDKGLAKLEIALGKGKKLHDKRESIKQRDIDRDQRRNY